MFAKIGCTRIVVKLDPDKEITEGTLKVINEVKLDYIIIGGTQNITLEKTLFTYEKIVASGYRGKVVQELTGQDVILPEADYFLVPVVLNSGEVRWLRDEHLAAINKYGCYIPWERIIPVGYLVLNPDSAVANLTGAIKLSPEETAAYTIFAEKIYGFKYLYIEYSGKYGDSHLVSMIDKTREKTVLMYGGGIRTAAQALEMSKYADIIVVGNLLHEEPEKFLEIAKSIRA